MSGILATTLYGLSETWLKAEDSKSFWELEKGLFKTFRSDRETMLKDRGGGVMLIVPKSTNPKLRKDLIRLNKNSFLKLLTSIDFDFTENKPISLMGIIILTISIGNENNA